MTTYSIKTYRVKLQVNDEPVNTTRSPEETVKILRAIYADLDANQEHFSVLALNGDNQVIGYKVLSNGGMGYANVDQKLLWRAALTLGGTSIIVAHNHPSGNPRPSSEDFNLTKAIGEAAKLLDFRLLDHIILGSGRYTYFSFAAEGRI